MRTFILAAAVAAASLAAQAQAQPRGDAPPRGNYWDSCRNVSVYGYGRDATMVGQCRDVRGRWRDSRLQFGDCRWVENIDGQLTCRGDRPGEERPPWAGDGRPPWGGDGRPGWGGGPGGGPDGGQGRPGYGRSAITLFSGPNFGGQPFRTDSEITNLPRQYNDRALSLRIEGRGAWQVCADSDFHGNCQVFDHSVGDLRPYGLGERVTSMRPVR